MRESIVEYDMEVLIKNITEGLENQKVGNLGDWDPI